MRYVLSFLLVFVVVLPCTAALAQDKPTFAVAKLTDHIYELTIDGGGYTVKVIASVGSDGLLLVDDGQKETVEALKKALATLPDSTPDIIINTHVHGEHIGGNAAFGKSAVIIGHENLRSRMRSGSYWFDEYPDEALPEIAFADSLTLFFNGEKIKLIAFPGAHDNSDIIVWFTESKLVCVGALSNWHHFPSVDGRTGHVLEYPGMVQRVIDVLPEDVTIIPGHGTDHNMTDYRAFQAMLAGAEEAVRQGLAQGKDMATLQKEDVLKDWTSFEGGYTDKNSWIRLLANAIQHVKFPAEPRAQFFETMYYAMKNKGVDEAIKEYHGLKGKLPEGYVVGDIELIVIADKLMVSQKSAEAVRFYELALQDFPDGPYAYYSHQALGDYYRDSGDKALAMEHYRKSLELNADNPDVKASLEKLETK